MNLLRGSGIHGLTSIPFKRKLSSSYVFRVFLQENKITKSMLINYALTNNLSWVVDESNSKNEFRRNFVRNKLLPIVETRWPDYRKTISNSLNLLDEQRELFDEMVEHKLSTITKDGNIIIDDLLIQNEKSQKQLIYSWVKQKYFLSLTKKQIDEIIKLCLVGYGLFEFKNLRLQIYKGVLQKISLNKLNYFCSISFCMLENQFLFRAKYN